MKRKYRIITFMSAIIICLMVIYLHLLSHDKTRKIYSTQIEKTIIDLKGDFLRDTINNIFIEIDRLRDVRYNSYKRNTEARMKRFKEEFDQPDEDFIGFFKDRFDDDSTGVAWEAFLWNKESKEIIYNSSNLYVEDIGQVIEEFDKRLIYPALINKGDLEGVFGVERSYVDELVKEEAGDLIRNRVFTSDSYIWVNEILNYEGGDDYAIRRVHPNLIETEGIYLSTNTKDIMGNLPYLEELEGINKDGELYFNYYFSKYNSPEVSEKMAYAKLYKDFDWVIAMGVHLDDIGAYIEKVNNDIYNLSSESIIRLLRYIFIVLLIGFGALYFIEERHLSNETESLEKEINLDSLTKAYSRRFGEKSLNIFFKHYILTRDRPAIMILDIDDFKSINDKYGHKMGDVVLVKVVEAIVHTLRSSDQLIRWGGDEFVGILPGLRESHILEVGEKLIKAVSSLKISMDDDSVEVSVSIGFSYFEEDDSDYNDALKRADKALYKSKEDGKGRVNLYL